MNRSACVSLALASLLVCAPARAAIVLLGGNHGVIGIDSGTEQCTVVEETPFTVDGLAVEDVADLFVDASGLTYFLTATFDPSLVARASLVPTALLEPEAIGFCPDGQLLVAGFEGTTPKLVRYDPDEGSFSDCSESLPNVTITGFGRVSCASSSCDAVMLDALALDGDRVFRNECQYTLRATFDPDAILVEPSGSVLVTGQFQEGADPDFVFIGGILRFDACPGPASQQLSLPAPTRI